MYGYTVVATITFTSVKPSISTSNVALNANPGTVLKSARPKDSKTPLTCSNWLSFDWDIWDLKISSKLIEIDENLLKSIHFVSKVINSTSKAAH